MKKIKILIGTLILSIGFAGCTSGYYKSSSAVYDDLYETHDKVAIAKKQQAQAEAQKAAADARRAEWEARLAEARASEAESSYYNTTSANPYEEVLADSYESAYARRLRGFESASYNMPSSYYDFRYGSSFNYVTAYDPAFYNVVVMGDQVWVEPRYITSMFGSWGRSSLYNNSWYFGWGGYAPSYAWWGYPRHSWGDWNWNICYNPYYNPWWGWGGPSWGHPHYPGWGSGWNPGHGSNYTSNIVRRPSSYTSPSSGRHYGQSVGGSTFNRNNNSGNRQTFGVRNSDRNNNSGQTFNRGNSTTYNRNNSGLRGERGGTTSYNRGDSYNSNNSGSSSFNRGSSSGSSGGGSFGGGGSSSGGGGVSGRNSGGR
ncbi:MAG: hypothetical protein RSB23_06965 [Alistipes sp.]